MKIGMVFPQTEIGNDPAIVADWARAVEALGFDHALAFDHVLGANPQSRPNWYGPYTSQTPFHEPLVLFSFMSSITTALEFVTGVIILPQRQTVLVAKQAATLDVLSRGRLRLGVGTGWNEVEYEGLGESFRNRGTRSEEQIALLRQLWEHEAITFTGRWHKVTDAGVNPLPTKRRIPIWLGGMHERVVERVGRFADGWFPQFWPGCDIDEFFSRLYRHAEEAGRDPHSIGIEVMSGGGLEAGRKKLAEWRHRGDATHLSFDTMGQGIVGRGHVDVLDQYAALALA
jgi:probable F420-dependent oxidoreductase